MSRDMWDPEQYHRYAAERGRPFADLIARVGATAPRHVVDLGCGTGEGTAALLELWPAARIEGMDSSPEMIERARVRAVPGRLHFTLGDMRTWTPTEAPDVVVSNAALHWVPEHTDLLTRLVAGLAPGGWLAAQVPANFADPTHDALRRIAGAPRWRERLAGAVLLRPVAPAQDYLHLLIGLGCRTEVWETTYLHVLTGPDPVLEWVKGTALRPVLARLDADETAEFLAEYGEMLRAAYPEHVPDGSVADPRSASTGGPFTVLPFRRIFMVARRPDSPSAGTP